MDNTSLPKICSNRQIHFIENDPLYNWAAQIRNLLVDIGFANLWENLSYQSVRRNIPSFLKTLSDLCFELDNNIAKSSHYSSVYSDLILTNPACYLNPRLTALGMFRLVWHDSSASRETALSINYCLYV